ncbi:MAG: histidinol-phosphate transaminase [Candidatus Abyssobacteria bacterium SURF_5]|uniref:Histidinol-phosphate aminotransferase n=1 Tax=Abyssobacteria bacterium (strain SURF_5) TaxID=2093360 RepID=A0A3A4NQS6_ABYX5|nr:MAG: histidinol-phosphate transaminase [Candidatus Abyssubacteria bacterium SURF_5]
MKFGRRHLDLVQGYVPGEQPQEEGFIKLNTNENPYPPSPRVVKVLTRISPDRMRKYPDPVFRRLRQKIALAYGVRPAQVFVGNGSDEVLSLLVRTFVDPDEKVLFTYPTYVLYETLARLNAVEHEAIELDAQFDLSEEVFRSSGKLFFIANPNSPTGKPVKSDVIRRLCDSFAGLVVADEAYADFSDTSSIPILSECPNLVILRTFSKAFSLASIRVGFALAAEDVIADLMKTKDSYNVNLLSQLAAEAAIEDIEYMRENARKIVQTRERMSASLRGLGFTVYPSGANFVLTKYNDNASPLYEELKRRKILVRYFPIRRLENCLRISVGTDAEVDALLTELGDIVRSGQ